MLTLPFFQIADFLEIVYDWIPASRSRKNDLFSMMIDPVELEKIIEIDCQYYKNDNFDILMSELLRFYCRRFEKLRPTEFQSAAVNAMKEFEVKDVVCTEADEDKKEKKIEKNGEKEQTETERNDDSSVSAAVEIDADDELHRDCCNYQTSLPYHSWLPLSITSKQPPQVLSSRGWVSAYSNYSPIEALVTQPTLRALAKLSDELKRTSSRGPLLPESLSINHDDSRRSEVLTNSIALLDQAMTAFSYREPVFDEQTSISDYEAQELEYRRYLTTLLPAIHRWHRFRLPRHNDLSLGLICGIQWSKDEGSINELTWESYLRLSLWDMMCDVPADILRQRRIDAENQHSRKKKKSVEKRVSLSTSKVSIEVASTPSASSAQFLTDDLNLAEGPNMLDTDIAMNFDIESSVNNERVISQDEELNHPNELPIELLNQIEIQQDETQQQQQGVGDLDLVSEVGSVDDYIEIEAQRIYWNWNVDIKKAQSGGMSSIQDINRMEKLMKALLGVDSLTNSGISNIDEGNMIDAITVSNVDGFVEQNGEYSSQLIRCKGIGWWNGLSASDRSFILYWLVGQIARSVIGRDMIERRIEMYNSVKAYLQLHEQKVMCSKPKSAKGKKRAKAKAKSKAAKASEVSPVVQAETSTVTKIVLSSCKNESAENNGENKAEDFAAENAVTSDGDTEMKREELCQEIEKNDNNNEIEDLKMNNGENEIEDQNVDGEMDKEETQQSIDGIHENCEIKNGDELNMNQVIPEEIDESNLGQSKGKLSKEKLIEQLESAARRFRIRRQYLGEDRYLNRYFWFENSRNTFGMLVVEFHVLIPRIKIIRPLREALSSSGHPIERQLPYRQITIERKRLPQGIASNEDVNFQLDAALSEQLASFASSRFGARGRQKRSRPAARVRKPKAASKTKGAGAATDVSTETKPEGGHPEQTEGDYAKAKIEEAELSSVCVVEQPVEMTSCSDQVIVEHDATMNETGINRKIDQDESVSQQNSAVSIGDSENLNVRRSGRSTKGQRKEPTFLENTLTDDAQNRFEQLMRKEQDPASKMSREELDLQLMDQTIEEMKTIKTKGAIFATFLSPLKRSTDGAVFMRRPLNGVYQMNPVAIDARCSYDGCLAFQSTSLSDLSTRGSSSGSEEDEIKIMIEEKVEIYEGPFRPISVVRKRKSKLTVEETEDVTAVQRLEPPVKVDDPNITIDIAQYIPILQWGSFRTIDGVQELISSLSNYSKRENLLKSELLELIHNNVIPNKNEPETNIDSHQKLEQQEKKGSIDVEFVCQESQMGQSDEVVAGLNIDWVVQRTIILASQLLHFKSRALDLVFAGARHPDYAKFRRICNELRNFLYTLKHQTLEFNVRLELCIIIQVRFTLFL